MTVTRAELLCLLAMIAVSLLLSRAARAQEDCRPLPEVLVEAELERGETLLSASWYPKDDYVIATLNGERSNTTIVVTEGEEVDQACVYRHTVWSR